MSIAITITRRRPVEFESMEELMQRAIPKRTEKRDWSKAVKRFGKRRKRK